MSTKPVNPENEKLLGLLDINAGTKRSHQDEKDARAGTSAPQLPSVYDITSRVKFSNFIHNYHMHYIWPLYIMSHASLNVLRQPLKLFSTQPMTGFHRDGYCRTSALDRGNHALAGVVSEDFLDYTARQGNDLRPVGLSEGCKWCLCTGRWLQALRAFESGSIPRSAVPKVDLDATEESALRSVDLETLRAFAVEGQGQQVNGVNGVSGVNGVNGH